MTKQAQCYEKPLEGLQKFEALRDLSLYKKGMLNLTVEQIKEKRAIIKKGPTYCNRLEYFLHKFSIKSLNNNWLGYHPEQKIIFDVKFPWIIAITPNDSFPVIKYSRAARFLIENYIIYVSLLQIHTRISHVGSKEYYHCFKIQDSNKTEYVAALKNGKMYSVRTSLKESVRSLKIRILEGHL